MPNIRQRFLAQVRQQPGWENAIFAPSRQGEREIHVRKGPGERGHFAVVTRRRMAHRRQDGTYDEIDTDWKAATGRDLLKIDVGDYTLRVGGQDALLFTNPRLLRYDLGALSLAITPLDRLYWDDGAGNTRIINPATVSIGALLENRPDILRFPDAYGAGFHYDLVAEADRVYKRVRVPRRNRLGAWSSGEFVVLGNRLELDPDSSLWYWEPVQRRWQQWDGTSEIVTYHKIQVRNSQNRRLYEFAKPFIQSNPTDRGIGPFNREIAAGQQWDATEQQVVTYSWYRLWNAQGNIRLDACFNPDVMPGATPFFLDPTLELDVTDPLSAEDNTYSGSRPNTGKNYADIAVYGGGTVRAISNWDVSATLDGTESITSAVLSVYLGSAPAGWDSNIRLEDTPDSTFPTSGSECNTRFSNWNGTGTNWDPGTTTGRQDTADFGSVFESVISGGGSVGEVAIDIDPIGTTGNVSTMYTYGYGDAYDMELHVVYEAGGTEYTESIAGALTTAGAISKQTSTLRAGSLTTAGALVRQTARAIAGAVTTAGTVARQTAKAYAGTLTSSGTLATVKTALMAIGGTLTSGGALAKQTAKSYAGALASGGTVTKQTIKAYAGTLTSAGALATIKTALVSLGGTLTMAGSLAKQTAKSSVGTLTSAGALVKQTIKSYSGTLSSAGAIATVKTFLRSVGGTLTSGGALTKQAGKSLVGSLSSAGAISKQTARALVGAVSPAGVLAGTRTALVSLAGTLTLAGATSKQTNKSLTGSISLAGGISRLISKTLAGVLSLAGNLLAAALGIKLDVVAVDAAVTVCSVIDAAVTICSVSDMAVGGLTVADATR